MPRVSIVIPMYNAEQFVGAAVRSVLEQTLGDWELVLSDDGSRDNSLAIAHELTRLQPQRIRVVNGVNGGAGIARNRGAAACSPDSEFIIFLDSDDFWEPDALEVLAAVLDREPDVLAVHGFVRIVDTQGQEYEGEPAHRQRRALVKGELCDVPADAPTSFESMLVENYPVTPGTTLIRRRVWDALGGFARETPCEDWEFNIRLARLAPLVRLQRVVVNWRRHPEATSHKTRVWRDKYLLVRKRSVLARENSPAQRAAAIAAFGLDCKGAWADLRREVRSTRYQAAARALARAASIQAAYWSAVRLRVSDPR